MSYLTLVGKAEKNITFTIYKELKKRSLQNHSLYPIKKNFEIHQCIFEFSNNKKGKC